MERVDGKTRETKALLNGIQEMAVRRMRLGRTSADCRGNWVWIGAFSTTGSANRTCAHTAAWHSRNRIGGINGSRTGGQDRPDGGHHWRPVAGTRFFRECLAKGQGKSSDERREWRQCIYAEIRSRVQSQGELSIQRMCELAGVSRASFYRHWEEREPDAAETELRDRIQRLALAHRYYGYRRITVLLQREGLAAGAKKVRRLMREDNLLAIAPRKFVVTTDSDHYFRVWPNLAQYLELTDINQLWVADLTYVRLEEEFVYLAVVLDAFSRRVIGWALARRMKTALPLAALEESADRAASVTGIGAPLGSGRAIRQSGVCGSAGAQWRGAEHEPAGRPWENGRCESFIKTLKQEEIDARPYRTMEELAAHVEEFIERIYNPVRLHSALAYLSPVEFEQQQERGKEAAAWLPASMSFPRHREISSDDQNHKFAGAGVKPAPATHRNEFQRGIPWRVALQQSPPPLSPPISL